MTNEQRDSEFADKIANMSYAHFHNLPKSGKPTPSEWTVLSCIIKENLNKTDRLEVIASGTGSKCIGQDKMSTNGDVLNDSHAEIVCRRAFLKYCYEELLLATTGTSKVFCFDKSHKQFILVNGVKFYFFTTHVPCGDAAIFGKNCDEIGICVRRKRSRKDSDSQSGEVPIKNSRMPQTDIFRTGAKCLPQSDKQDGLGEGVDYHNTGLVRTKPGRGSRTLSVSCSDKIAKWCLVGMQGALLSLLLERPIYLESFTIAGCTHFSKEAMQRALYGRLEVVNLKPPFYQRMVTLNQATSGFEYAKEAHKQPSSASIIWHKHIAKTEVSVDGRKQGVTKKNLHSKAGRLSICKRSLMESFANVVSAADLETYNNKCTYYCLKCKATDYQEAWDSVKNKAFQVWTRKNSDLLNFSLN